MLKGCIESNEKIVNDKDETDTEYINDELNNIKCVFNGFCSMYNIDYVPTTINNSTFIIASEWLRLKRSVLNPNNNDNKCFQYSVTLSLYHEQIGKNSVEYQRLNHLSTTLIGKILIFHHRKKIIKLLK